MTSSKRDPNEVSAASFAGIRWVALSRLVVQMVTWALTILIVRILSPSDYGLMTLSGFVTLFAGMLLDGGLGAAFIQRRDVPDAVLVAASTAVTLASLAFVVAIQVIANPCARFFSAPLLEPVLRVASFQFVITALTVVPTSLLTARMQFRSLAFSQASAGISQSVITLALALGGAGVWSLVIGSLIAGAIRLTVTWAQAHPPTGVSLDFRLLRPYLAFSVYLVGQRLLWFWVEQVDTFIVGRVLGARTLGYFSVAKTFAHTPLDKISEIVNQVSLPAFAALQADKEVWLEALSKVLRIAAAVSFPLFWGMAAIAPTAMQMVLGAKWLDATVPFALFCLILPLRTIHAVTAAILVGLGRTDISFRNILMWALVLPPAILTGSRFGVGGVAGAWAIAFPCVFTIGSIRVAKQLGFPVMRLISPLWRPAGCAAVMAALVYLGGELPSPLSSAQRLTMQVPGGAAVYLFTLRWLAPNLFEDCRRVTARLLRGA